MYRKVARIIKGEYVEEYVNQGPGRRSENHDRLGPHPAGSGQQASSSGNYAAMAHRPWEQPTRKIS